MSKQTMLFIIVIIIIALLGVGIYYFISKNIFVTPALNNTDVQKSNPPQPSQAQLEQMKKDFPDVLVGIISLSEKGDNTTIKTDDGKVWTIWPPNAKAFYEHKGIKNEQRVELQAKILDESRIQWVQIKPI